MAPTNISKEQLAELKTQHAEFLLARLQSDATRSDWRLGVQSLFAELLTRKLSDMIDVDSLLPALRKALESPSVLKLFVPIAREAAHRTLVRVRNDDASLGTFVTADARRAIDTLLERSDLVPEEIVRNVFEQEAVEELIAVVLYDGLKEFNDTANPFFADWGLPALVKRVVPIGGGAVMKAIEGLRAEFDKRLEPEIRKFIAAFTRRAKKKIADLLIAKAGDPHFVLLRKNVVHFLYDESLRALTKGVDDEAERAGDEAATAMLLGLLASDELWKRVDSSTREFMAAHGGATVGETLSAIGVSKDVDLGPFADLVWPHVKEGIASDTCRSFATKLSAEFYDTLA